jgi:hypothetical protein
MAILKLDAHRRTFPYVTIDTFVGNIEVFSGSLKRLPNLVPPELFTGFLVRLIV